MDRDIFKKARYKLTAYYVFVIFVILFVFSSALIATIESRVRQRYGANILYDADTANMYSKISDEVEFAIYSIDSTIVILIAVLSYFLAGKTLSPIKENYELQKKFFADASHDLRTPIAIITTESEVTLQNSNSTITDYKNSLKSNLDEARRLSSIVNDLLILAREGNRSNTETKIEVNLSDLIADIINNIKIQAEKKNLIINFESNNNASIKGDPLNISRAITNIIQNSINYTLYGSIKVSLNSDNKHVNIEISDTGVGINKEELPFIFDRFYKASHSRNDTSGSGLGLPIAKEIIQNHGGTISIDSTEGVGTKIFIRLPMIKNKI